MTTANVANLGMKSCAVQAANGMLDIQKKTKEAADVFGAMMNQFGSAGLPDASVQQDDIQAVSAVPDTSDQMEYADQMSYTDKGANVTEASAPSISERVDSAKEELGGYEETAVASISEALEVTDEEVRSALDVLGMTVFDLLNPQNLGQLVMQLTGMEDSTQLLMNPDFQKLMNDIGQLGSELMNQLNLEMGQLNELIRRMDMLTEPSVFEETMENLPVDAASTVEDLMGATEGIQTTENQPTAVTGEEIPLTGHPAAKEQNQNGHSVAKTEEDQTAHTVLQEHPEDNLRQQTDFEQEFSGRQEASQQTEGFERTDAAVENENPAAADVFEMPVSVPTAEMPQVSNAYSSYTSVDTLELIHQVVEHVQTAVREDTASIEMQLNPEHLGRVYVNLTSRAGTVSAQFTATSEAVRAALETQIVELRENLNQAGVKVDAIEVTVASHEFEQNLEQNARQEERQAAEQESQNRGRRNITLDALDELSGVMTEEEALVAQMMKDNGNSMDVTA